MILMTFCFYYSITLLFQVQEATRSKFQAVQELDDYKRSVSEDKAVQRTAKEQQEHLNASLQRELSLEKDRSSKCATELKLFNEKSAQHTLEFQKLISEKDSMETSLQQMTVERDTIKMTSNTLQKSLHRLQQETKQEQDKVLHMTKELDSLNDTKNNLSMKE